MTLINMPCTCQYFEAGKFIDENSLEHNKNCAKRNEKKGVDIFEENKERRRRKYLNK